MSKMVVQYSGRYPTMPTTVFVTVPAGLEGTRGWLRMLPNSARIRRG